MAHLVDSRDFERVLRSPSRARTAHFAVHHLPAAPGSTGSAPSVSLPQELSTMPAMDGVRPVDDSPSDGFGRRLGVVLPKRHARRAVTRSLLKRQVHSVAARHAAGLAGGVWIVRLRAPFDRAQFPSAASLALRTAARSELDTLFEAAGRTATS
ncbi:MAG: ribonuclease P protein component [Pseudomonadota bacterium]|nr:ribonuclease P protein component [Pseudomonadota bacterium]